MHAVLGLSRLCLRTELTNRQRDYVTKITTAAGALSDMLNNLVDFSKADVGELEVDRIPFELGDVLANVCSLVGLRADEKRLELVLDVAADVPNNFIGDPARITQILVNLCNNGVQFTQAGEVIVEVRAEPVKGSRVTLQVAVIDTGIGMTPEHCATAFHPFQQAEDQLTRAHGGLGIGLAVTKRLVESMGGDITIRSQLGVGTTVAFTLRLGVTAARAPIPVRAPLAAQRARVLVVDDSTATRAALRELLTDWGFEVALAPNGAAGLTALHEDSKGARPFAAVLVDWKMPGMDGLAFAARLQADPIGFGNPGVVLLAPMGDGAIATQAAALGVRAVVAKPVVPSRLYDALVTLLGSAVAVAPTVAARPPSVVDRLGGRKVLVVEDNDINQQILGELLEEVGIYVTFASNGADALLRAFPDLDCILMDLQMPVMNGYTATAHLQQRQDLRHIPIIAVTANALSEDRAAVLAAGMRGFVAKPIEPALLHAALLEVLPVHAVPGERLGPRRKRIRAFGETQQHLQRQPHIEGIDIAAALRRLGGNEALLWKLLERFDASQHDVVLRLRHYLATSQTEVAAREAHTLRGLAANLGAARVAEHAGELEAAIHAGKPTATLLDRLDESIRHVTVGVSLAVEAAARSVESGGHAVAVDLAADLTALRRLLSDEDAAAAQLAQNLAQRAASGPLRDALSAVAKAATNYEFDEATVLLNDISTAVVSA